MWTAWPPGSAVPQCPCRAGKRDGDHIIRMMWIPEVVSRPYIGRDAAQHKQVGVVQPAEDVDGQLERLVILG